MEQHLLSTRKSLSEYLVRGGNNLDLIRLIAACAVIYGHSFSMIPTSGKTDFIFQVTGYYSADLAVKTFFFMSGLLVTNSILRLKSPIIYISHRILRIMPALIFVTVSSVFIIGPIFSKLVLTDYFNDSQTYSYLVNTIMFKLWGTQGLGYYNLPGLFLDNPAGRVVNAPLWTLAVEMYAYLFILAAFMVGAFNRQASILLFLVILVDSLLEEPFVFNWLPQTKDFELIPFCFAIGGILAIYKDSIKINALLPIGFFLLFWLFKGATFQHHIFYTFIFMLALYISTLPLIIKLNLKHDISYGVYLWGWPLQQAIITRFNDMNIVLYQILSLILALIFGYISWIIVEKPSMGISKQISEVLKRRKLA